MLLLQVVVLPQPLAAAAAGVVGLLLGVGRLLAAARQGVRVQHCCRLPPAAAWKEIAAWQWVSKPAC